MNLASRLLRNAGMKQPLIVNYGMGVDSTAMLIGLRARGIQPDLVIFADTGSEKPSTYAYLATMNAWLAANGMPSITVVRRYGADGQFGLTSKASKTGPGYSSLEGNCLQNETMPSLAYGRKSCSLKWKAEPMDAWLRTWAPAVEAWAAGVKPIKAIGYDCGAADSKRAVDRSEDAKFAFWYPLRDWGWTREDCIAAIEAAGLPVPTKSACFFCPASKPWEVALLALETPDLFVRAIELEDGSQAKNVTAVGLWRSATKTRPGSWRTWAEQEGILAPGTTTVVATVDSLRRKVQGLRPAGAR